VVVLPAIGAETSCRAREPGNICWLSTSRAGVIAPQRSSSRLSSYCASLHGQGLRPQASGDARE
jgi:hypothetical protein